MLLTSEQIKIEALSLPPDERSDLLLRLAESLGAGGEEAIDQEWLSVAKHRLEELRSGKVTGIPADRVFADLRARKS